MLMHVEYWYAFHVLRKEDGHQAWERRPMSCDCTQDLVCWPHKCIFLAQSQFRMLSKAQSFSLAYCAIIQSHSMRQDDPPLPLKSTASSESETLGSSPFVERADLPLICMQEGVLVSASFWKSPRGCQSLCWTMKFMQGTYNLVCWLRLCNTRFMKLYSLGHVEAWGARFHDNLIQGASPTFWHQMLRSLSWK